ncbi:MAG: DeoR family transcriptional regulator, partial [Spirochaetota bacterium]
MKRNARLDEIVKICKNSGHSDIKSLARELDVSEITVRRDLSLLENLKL